MTPLKILVCLLINVLHFTREAYAQGVTVSDSEICQRYGQSSAVIGNKVYYDGGWISKTAVKASGDAARQAKLLAIDVSISWKTSEVQLEQITTAPVQHLTENSVLFSDASNLYQYGFFQDLTSLFKTWTLSTTNASPSWSSSTPKTAGLQTRGNKLMFPVGNSGYTQGGGFGYSVGGSNDGVVSFSSSVMQYDLENHQVANISVGFTSMSKGALVYLPIGASGSLVSLGGLDSNNNQISPENVAIFDISAKKWYSQKATGDYPSSLISGTAAVVAASDSSSYNIYVTNPLGMFILSVPSFTWYTASSTGDNAPWLRERPSLNLVGGTQLLLYGGQDGTDCDTQAVYVFDATSLTWKDNYNSKAGSYLVPSVITDIIGGDGEGGASVNEPSSWDDNELQALFSRRSSQGTTAISQTPSSTMASAPTDRNSTPVTTSDPDNQTPTQGSNTQAGKTKPTLPLPAIVGISVGGIVSIAIVIAISCVCWRRRIPTPESQNETNPTSVEGPSELHATEKPIHELHSPTEKNHIPAYAELEGSQS